MKKIFIINGSGGVGKDAFISLVSEESPPHTVWNFSSIDRVKEIAKEIGWNGGKSEKNRRMLSKLKALCEWYSDLPFRSMEQTVSEFQKDPSAQLLFLHIREPKGIRRASEAFQAQTVLVTRDSVKSILSNKSDKHVFDFQYDFQIENNGTLEDLRVTAKEFLSQIEMR